MGHREKNWQFAAIIEHGQLVGVGWTWGRAEPAGHHFHVVGSRAVARRVAGAVRRARRGPGGAQGWLGRLHGVPAGAMDYLRSLTDDDLDSALVAAASYRG